MAPTNTKPSTAPAAQPAVAPPKRSRLSQEDVPGFSLDQALRVPRAIADGYAYKPTRPLNVASAMKMSPSSGPFRGITGAAIAYGLTVGGSHAPEIGITPLGMRIVRPTRDGDDVAARREAILKPKVIGEFLRQYDAAPLPTEPIARNVLQEKGVPIERLDDVLNLILEGAQGVGFLREISGKRYVDLTGAAAPTAGDREGGAPATELPSTPPARLPEPVAGTPVVSVTPAVQVNVEIHIAADATSEVIEDIFRNMRRYVLTGDGPAEEE